VSKTQQNVQTILIGDLIKSFDVIPQHDAMKLQREINHTRKHWFFIRYFAEGQDFLPMEVKPVGIQFHDYHIDYNYNSQKINWVRNQEMG
jgi:hypothetical protein